MAKSRMAIHRKPILKSSLATQCYLSLDTDERAKLWLQPVLQNWRTPEGRKAECSHHPCLENRSTTIATASNIALTLQPSLTASEFRFLLKWPIPFLSYSTSSWVFKENFWS